MERIQSFSVNHDLLTPGLYLSRIDKNTKTYDIRLKTPNAGDYIPMDAAHTIEHLGATFLRNSALAGKIVYFGPMGCGTGFYLVVFETDDTEIKELLLEAFRFIATFSGKIPGASRVECGNYLCHNLEKAKKLAKDYIPYLESWTPEKLIYKK